MGKKRKKSILEEIQAVWKDGDVVELRILNTQWGTISGYYDNLNDLATAASKFEGKYNIYVTINPVKPEVQARAFNRLVYRAKNTTADIEILERRWLAIDIDPVRPSGVSSSDVERKEAKAVAFAIRKYLSNLGWVKPILASSGNGFHLLYRIKLPNDQNSTNLIKSILLTLDLLFSNDLAKVDTSVFNAARIWKLYGTLACKGDNTIERPHRRSRIISNNIPIVDDLVTMTQMKEFIKLLPQTPKKADSKKGKQIDLAKQLSEWNIQFILGGRWSGNADLFRLTTCPFSDDHDDGAYALQFDAGGVMVGCHHDRCQGKGWAELKKLKDPDGKAITKGNDDDEKGTQVDKLLELAAAATYFKNDIDEACASVPVNEHNEIYKVMSRKFKQWIVYRYYKDTGAAPNADSMAQALAVIETKALHEGEEKKLEIRVAEFNGSFYYDLGDEKWSVAKISPNKWELVAQPPQLFMRNKNLKTQLVRPGAGNIDFLDQHLQLPNKRDLLLLKVYLVHCLIPDIPHWILVLYGQKGAAKTTTMRMFRALVDPAARDTLTLPKGTEELALILNNNYMPAFDNLDYLRAALSDMLCTACTGGGLSKRTLYTNDDETILNFRRCVVLNGINVVATRPDLLDRSILLELPRLTPEQRREERVVWEEFHADRPAIFTGMLDTLAEAMRIYPDANLDNLPRMADATRWGWAIAEAMGAGGDKFLAAYVANQQQTNAEAVAEHPVAAAVVALINKNQSYTGSVAALLTKLEQIALEQRINTRASLWPKSASVLSRRLNEIKSNLQELDIEFTFRNGKNSTIIEIYKNDKKNSKSKK